MTKDEIVKLMTNAAYKTYPVNQGEHVCYNSVRDDMQKAYDALVAAGVIQPTQEGK